MTFTSNFICKTIMQSMQLAVQTDGYLRIRYPSNVWFEPALSRGAGGPEKQKGGPTYLLDPPLLPQDQALLLAATMIVPRARMPTTPPKTISPVLSAGAVEV